MSQSRRLPSWPPLARCTVECEMNRCDMSAAFDRTDGRCAYHGKCKDGLFKSWSPKAAAVVRAHEVRPATGSSEKYPYDLWFDGTPRTLVYGQDFHTCLQTMAPALTRAAYKRRIRVLVRPLRGAGPYGTIYVEALREVAA